MKKYPVLDRLEQEMMEKLYGTMDVFGGAYSLRSNGKCVDMSDAEGVVINAKPKGRGIEVRVESGLKDGMVYVPVILNQAGLNDKVDNDFYVGAGAQVVIMAGCGICSDTIHLTQHDGVHRFFIGAGAKVRYIEKHLGTGSIKGRRVMNPTTHIFLEQGSLMEMESTQVGGVSSAKRTLRCEVGDEANLVVAEKILTDNNDRVTTRSEIILHGVNSRASLMSRSVAEARSRQKFSTHLIGQNICFGHSECDAIILDEAKVEAVPCVSAKHADAQLVHEAAIGKVAEEQIVKLMTLGMSREAAERTIIDGFLGVK